MNTATFSTFADLAATPQSSRAVVIGASIGGLLAARALADHMDEVIVLERDALPPSPEHRRNVPQGRHVHALLARGSTIVERMFPGIGAEMVADGAMRINAKRDIRWYQQGGYHAEPRRALVAMLQSRPLLEFHLRRRVTMLPNVTVLAGCRVTGLRANRGATRITGVRVSTVDESNAETELPATLVVDASGRGTRVPAWLENLGCTAPQKIEAGLESRYASRRFRRMPDTGDARMVTAIIASPRLRRGGVMLAQEDDRWLVTLSSRDGCQPPTELSAFIDWAGSLEAPDIFEVVRQAMPLDDGVVYRFPRSVRRRWEVVTDLPAGVVPLGDAICAFNPVYGQGMTVAAVEAEQLGRCLATGSDNLAGRFLAAIAPTVEAAWMMAANGDMRYADRPVDLPRHARLINAYLDRLLDAATRDPVVAGAYQRVTNLIDPPAALRRPSVAIRVALNARRQTIPTLGHAVTQQNTSSRAA